jgi:hypothetical protein
MDQQARPKVSQPMLHHLNQPTLLQPQMLPCVGNAVTLCLLCSWDSPAMPGKHLGMLRTPSVVYVGTQVLAQYVRLMLPCAGSLEAQGRRVQSA